MSQPDDLLKDQRLLAELEDILSNIPPRETIRHELDENFAWLGRAAAVMEQWRSTEFLTFPMAVNRFHSRDANTSRTGLREIMVALNKARSDLRLRTDGPVNVVISQGRVFEYFEEVRRIVEGAVQDVFFIDPYLDADFVGRYLVHIRAGTAIRLLIGNDPLKLSKLLPAVELFAKQSGQTVNVRSTAGLHDRYLFIDQTDCYHSGASFKDGAKKAGTVISQITDAFQPMWQTYDAMWVSAKVER